MAKREGARQGKSLTISDVAAHAGVSAMTVSRVINGESGVRETTKNLVQAAIAELNYAPNPAAQSLAGAGHIQIGILYSNPSAAYLNEFLVGGLDRASRGGVQLIVDKCEPGESEAEVARRLIAAGVDGLILPPPLCDSDLIHAVLAETLTLAVAVATNRVAPNVSAVSIDDHRAAVTMTEHIIRLGHQRIGFITGNPNQTASAERLAGYREALLAADLQIAEDLIVPGLFTYRSGLDAAELLLDLEEPPTAIFASNDDMAAAAVAAAHRRGLDVPGDITVCGFDDTALSTTIWPELTTIHQPITDMARSAVDMLLEEIRRRRAGQAVRHRHEVLAYEMIRRQSDAAPRKRPMARIAS